MNIGKDPKGLLFFALVDEEAWTFWNEEDEEDLKSTWCELCDGWDAP